MEKLLNMYNEKINEGLDKYQAIQSVLKTYSEEEIFNIDIVTKFMYDVLELN